MKNKIRLDTLVQEHFPDLSKTFIQSLIMQGKVRVDDKVVTKAGTQVKRDIDLSVDLERPKYVSRAGYKLEKALDHFDIDVSNLVALDAGISTGGFTDCLLQRGIKKVYGIDVGYGQVHEKVAQNPRVEIHERTNLRNAQDLLKEQVDIVTLDLSFISVLKVIEVVKDLLKDNGKLIVLIKPQFEAEKHQVGRKGVIKDAAVHEAVLKKVIDGIQEQGFVLQGHTDSPILGGSGNKEFLAYFIKNKD